jgi:hypothetical protein
MKACEQTLLQKGDKTTGWSTGWRVNLWARLHQGKQAFHTDGRIVVEHALNGYTANGTKVEWMVVFCPRSSKMHPIGGGEASRESNVVSGLGKRLRARLQRFPKLSRGGVAYQ